MTPQIDATELSELICLSLAGRAISPQRFSDQVTYDLRELEERAAVVPETAERDPGNLELQAYMRRALQVLGALLEMGFSPQNALFWFRTFRVVELNDTTPIRALSEDCAEIVIQSLRSVFVLNHDELGTHYERIREDTQSVQEEIFKEVKMLPVAEAARLMRMERDGRSPMDIAREIEATKLAIFVMHGRTPVLPSYQFDFSGPKRIMAGLIKTLAPYRSSWEIVVWLWGRNGWLGGESAMDLLDDKPLLVLDAAFQDIAEEVDAGVGG